MEYGYSVEDMFNKVVSEENISLSKPFSISTHFIISYKHEIQVDR